MDFPFHETYRLSDYKNYAEPSVFFGMYRYEDLRLLDTHHAEKTIFWTGQDALKFDWDNNHSYLEARNVTAHHKISDMISQFEPCHLVQPAAFGNVVSPQKLGRYIYAYCPSSAPDYHGRKIIDELILKGYEIIVGDGSLSQIAWKYKRDDYYNDIFIGLCLSEFAGGGGSIIEMGLRGINVITNVFNLPNCLPFKDADEVEELIEKEKSRIGTTDKKRAEDVWNNLDHEFKWLEI